MMKKVVKKLFVMAMAVTVAATAMPTMSVEAAISAPKTYIVNRDTVKDYESYHSLYVSGLEKSTKIFPKTVKSSKKAVLVPWYMEKYNSSYSYTTTWLDENSNVTGDDEYGYDNWAAYVGFRVKKAGTATLSYKIGTKTYKTKITAKAYKNPLKTVNIAGIKNGSSTNLASKLKDENYTFLNMSANKNNATVKVVANSGWKITEVAMSNYADGSSREFDNYDGVGSATLNIGNVKKTDRVRVTVDLFNTTTGAYQYCYFYINQD